MGSVSVGEMGGNSEILRTVIAYKSVEKKMGGKENKTNSLQPRDAMVGGKQTKDTAKKVSHSWP